MTLKQVAKLAVFLTVPWAILHSAAGQSGGSNGEAMQRAQGKPEAGNPIRSTVAGPESVLFRISSLTRELAQSKPGLPVRVLGQIIKQEKGESIMVQDDSGTIRVKAHMHPPLIVNDDGANAWGKLSWDGTNVFIDDATFQVVSWAQIAEQQFAAARQQPHHLSLLTNAQQVLNLSAEEAAWKYPVRLRAAITTVGLNLESLWLQDDTAGIYAASPNVPVSRNLAVGDEVEIEAVSGPGGYSPIIELTAVKATGRKRLPEAPLLTVNQLVTGQYDNDLIEVRGTLRSFSITTRSVNYEISDDTGLMPLYIPGGEVFTNLLDSLVRARVVCRSFFDRHRQITGAYLWLPLTNMLVAEEKGVADPFTLPTKSIALLSEFSQRGATHHRVKMAGAVTFNQPDGVMFVQDETGGIPVYLDQSANLLAGDRVEVTGYLSAGDFGHVIRDANYRKVGHAAMPKPCLFSDVNINPNLNGSLVQIDARVLATIRREKEYVMSLQAGNFTFEAILPSSRKATENSLPSPGSVVRLQGAYSVQGNELRMAHGLRLYVPATEPIQILQAPTWWNTRHTAMVMGTLAGIIMAATLWVMSLRHRVKQQTVIIQERMAREAALQERYREIFEGANDLIFTLDTEGRLTSLNPAGRDALGYNVEEVSQLAIGRILAPGSGGLEKKVLEMARAGGDPKGGNGDVITCESEFISKDGRRLLVETSLRLMQKDGKAHSIQAISRDITERKKAEAALAQASSLLKTLLDNVLDVIYFKDRDSRFVRVSRSTVRKALGHGAKGFDSNPTQQPISAEQMEEFTKYLQGKSDFDLFAEEHARAAFEDEQEIMRSRKPIAGKLERETHPDGHVSWCLTTKMPWFDETGKIVGTFGVSKDITALKQAESELEATHQRLLETSRLAGMAEVATGVLHNVGNVLNSVNVSCSLLVNLVRNSKISGVTKVSSLLQKNSGRLAEYLTQDGQGQKLPDFLAALATALTKEQELALEELEQLTNHVEHVNQVVAMQQNYARVAGVLEEISPRQLVEDALHMNSAALARHGIEVRREIEETTRILTEKHKVLQILVNLISNAKYAMDDAQPKDKLLTIKVANDGKHCVTIQVIDKGVGIQPENLTRVFSQGFTTRAEGHGFGLHSSALAARDLGGSLSAASDGPGKGSVFTLVLPREIERQNG
ncbi:MAG: PAS domain S-box protein [Verrucomicrobiota bacterium]|jgi:PAS domain S-box-containing protein